ncbi:hypothetical protein NL676_034256 [Syzygium grande]|nr:hypothetical protein NL676_034256 [Syzygium grande]
MHSLKVSVRARRSLRQLGSSPHQRSLSAQPHYASHDDVQDQVLVDGRATSRTAILNRPSALNSLTTSMLARLKRLYESWEENPNVGFVSMKLAILDGVTMASGAGISLPGMFRLATDKTVFSHPEVQIGFHPDAGASFHLSRLPGYLGEYLALTGDKLNGMEMVACRLATHYSLNAEIEEADSYGEWCAMTLKKLREASPLSLKVTLRSIREGRFQTLDQCLTREYRISLCGISGEVSKDFCEGVRARLVDKDFAPKWDPPSLEEVAKDMVDFCVSPLISEPELELPTASREPSV